MTIKIVIITIILVNKLANFGLNNNDLPNWLQEMINIKNFYAFSGPLKIK